MRPDILAGTYHCPYCGFYASAFPITINREAERIDEAQRERALRNLRVENFNTLLDACEPLLSRGARLLDVGCAHGWFLEEAQKRGYATTGIEPDKAMAEKAQAAGHAITVGFFPEGLGGSEPFNAISFNDVFEHLENLPRVVSAARERLTENGILIINLPMSDGIFFRTARMFGKLGISGPLKRLWQWGLPSPHVSYFSVTNLARFMQDAGFVLGAEGKFKTLSPHGLMERIGYDKQAGKFKIVCLYALLLIGMRVLAFLPPDIRYFVFRKKDS